MKDWAIGLLAIVTFPIWFPCVVLWAVLVVFPRLIGESIWDAKLHREIQVEMAPARFGHLDRERPPKMRRPRPEPKPRAAPDDECPECKRKMTRLGVGWTCKACGILVEPPPKFPTTAESEIKIRQDKGEGP